MSMAMTDSAKELAEQYGLSEERIAALMGKTVKEMREFYAQEPLDEEPEDV